MGISERPDSSSHEELTEQQQQSLQRIARSRSKMMVCFYTLPLYIFALLLLLSNGRSINTFMFVYMIVYAIFAINMVIRVCPVCHDQFYVKGFLLNFFSRRCVHCRQPSEPLSHREKI